MPHVSGEKIRGSHTTVLDLAHTTVKLAQKISGVEGIAPGFIRSGQKAAGGTRGVKISTSATCLTLTVRQTGSVQELRVYVSSDADAVAASLAKSIRGEGVRVSFDKRQLPKKENLRPGKK